MIQAVRNWSCSSIVSKVRSFLSLAGYYRRFVEDFLKIDVPLIELTMKKTKFVWTNRYENSFQELKHRLITSPVLVLPVVSERLIVYADTSRQ